MQRQRVLNSMALPNGGQIVGRLSRGAGCLTIGLAFNRPNCACGGNCLFLTMRFAAHLPPDENGVVDIGALVMVADEPEALQASAISSDRRAWLAFAPETVRGRTAKLVQHVDIGQRLHS